MKEFTSITDPQIAVILNAGGIGVLRTDTLYGVVARADDESAVERVYAVKGRDHTKSPIVLIGELSQMFDDLPAAAELVAAQEWPGKTSVIVPSQAAPAWIKRGNGSVAYRLPDNDDLRELLRSTGPLIAPSANPEGRIPAADISEARTYFGQTVDFYVDGGHVDDDTPSQLLKIQSDGTVDRLR